MGRWGRDRCRRSQIAARPTLDALEDRALLTPLPGRPTLPPRAASVAQRPLDGMRMAAAAGARPAPPPRPDRAGLDDQVTFAYRTVQDGQRLAESRPVRDVGLDYAKLSVSHDARKVGAAYLSAAIRGDGKDLERLGKTPLVNKVGQDFHKLSESSAVQKIGNAFEKFGKSVAHEFSRLFGLD